MAWYHYPPGQVRRAPAAPQKQGRSYPPNPYRYVRSGFDSGNIERLLQGWDTASHTIDSYLIQELRPMRARSRKMVRANPYGKRFIQTIKSNVVGPMGVTVQAQSQFRGEVDYAANDAIEAAWRTWGTRSADYLGRLTWVDIQSLCIACAAQDGEFLVQVIETAREPLRLKIIDPELLDVEKNHSTNTGGEIRLGVEYDSEGRRVRYHFKRKTHPVSGGYDNFERYELSASEVIHGFIAEWPDQSRGIPWMHAALERAKHLEKYDEAAIVKARSTAATMAVMRSPDGDQYEGDEDYNGGTLDQFEPGIIKDIGNREITHLDSDYPHQMYGEFVQRQLQSIASGLGISYHSLSGDLEGVNYSSIRAGVLEDREIFKGLQNWFIRSLVRPVYERWLAIEITAGRIRIPTRSGVGLPLRRPIEEYMPAHYQGRRWAWVDPQKDGFANQLAIQQRLKSRSQIIREQGDDPDEVFRDCARDEQKLRELGLMTVEMEAPADDDET